MQPLGTKKVTRPLSTKKIMQPLRTKKSRNLLVKQKIIQPLGGKNVLKIQILVTIKLQEIGTGHLGLVSTLFIYTKNDDDLSSTSYLLRLYLY